MRICIVTVASYAHGIGGMQAHGLDLARGLVRAGHDVEVIAPRHPEGLSELDHEGARWHFVDAPSRHRRLPMRHPQWLRRSAEFFERLQAERPFDVVHSESTSALGLLRNRVHHRLPVAVKFHGNFLGLARQALSRARAEHDLPSLGREAKEVAWIAGAHFLPPDNFYRFRSCEAMVPSRQQLEDPRRSHLLSCDRVHVVPNGIDTEVFRGRSQSGARAELGLGNGTILVSAGRLNREKGFDVAIRALAGLNSGARLAIVGSGEEEQALKHLTTDLGLAQRVIFVGKQPQDRVAAYIAAADVVLFPTVRDEAAPLVLLEAMACERPVIASRVGGITEVIDDGTSGVLVSPGDMSALVAAVEPLLANDARRAGMGAAARRRILAEYTVELMIQRTVAVFRIAAARMGRSL